MTAQDQPANKDTARAPGERPVSIETEDLQQWAIDAMPVLVSATKTQEETHGLRMEMTPKRVREIQRTLAGLSNEHEDIARIGIEVSEEITHVSDHVEQLGTRIESLETALEESLEMNRQMLGITVRLLPPATQLQMVRDAHAANPVGDHWAFFLENTSPEARQQAPKDLYDALLGKQYGVWLLSLKALSRCGWNPPSAGLVASLESSFLHQPELWSRGVAGGTLTGDLLKRLGVPAQRRQEMWVTSWRASRMQRFTTTTAEWSTTVSPLPAMARLQSGSVHAAWLEWETDLRPACEDANWGSMTESDRPDKSTLRGAPRHPADVLEDRGVSRGLQRLWHNILRGDHTWTASQLESLSQAIGEHYGKDAEHAVWHDAFWSYAQGTKTRSGMSVNLVDPRVCVTGKGTGSLQYDLLPQPRLQSAIRELLIHPDQLWREAGIRMMGLLRTRGGTVSQEEAAVPSRGLVRP